MHPQVVQDEEDFLVRILDQRAQELDEFVAIEGIIDDHP